MFDFSLADGFIFDCDGTLLDTLDAWVEAERDLFAQAGALTREQEDEIHAAPIEKACAILHDRYGVGESANAVLAHLDDHLLPHYRDISQTMPGAAEFVRAVHEHGIPCIVVSSSPRRYLEAGLDRAGLLDCFQELVSTDEVGVSKQEFGIYEAALEALGCSDASRVWAVDDAPYAVAVMHAFGLKTICVGPRDSQAADFNVASLFELL